MQKPIRMPTVELTRVHTGRKLTGEKCPYCGSHLIIRKGTRSRKHTISTQRYECKACGKKFTDPEKMERSYFW